MPPLGAWMRRLPSPLLLLVLLTGLSLWAVVEFPRFSVARHDCAWEYALHTDFTREPICTENPRRNEYERAELVQCTRAERYVASEFPLFCTVNRWMALSLPAEAATFLRARVNEITEGATSYPMIGIASVVGLVAFSIVFSSYTSIQQHAISTGARQQETEAFASVIRTMGRNSQSHAALAASPSVTDVTDVTHEDAYLAATKGPPAPPADSYAMEDDEETDYDGY